MDSDPYTFYFKGEKNALQVEIPSTFTSIGPFSFKGCKCLKKINIPRSIVLIERGSFQDCKKLKTIVIPKSVVSIENGAFLNCESLFSISIPEGITKLSDFLFWGCASLQNVDIPISVTEIGDKAFFGCYKLKSIRVLNSDIEIHAEAFSDCKMVECIIPYDAKYINENTIIENCKIIRGVEPDQFIAIKKQINHLLKENETLKKENASLRESYERNEFTTSFQKQNELNNKEMFELKEISDDENDYENKNVVSKYYTKKGLKAHMRLIDIHNGICFPDDVKFSFNRIKDKNDLRFQVIDKCIHKKTILYEDHKKNKKSLNKASAIIELIAMYTLREEFIEFYRKDPIEPDVIWSLLPRFKTPKSITSLIHLIIKDIKKEKSDDMVILIVNTLWELCTNFRLIPNESDLVLIPDYKYKIKDYPLIRREFMKTIRNKFFNNYFNFF